MNQFMGARWFYVIPIIILAGIIGIIGWSRSQAQEQRLPAQTGQDEMLIVSEPIQPIPLHIELDVRKVELGETLFHDPQLSRDNSIACASCHGLDTGGTDRLVRSVGIDGAIGPINAPTVFNSDFNFRQFWDGRAATLTEQIDGPIHNPLEMDSNWPDIVAKLQRSPAYMTAFNELFPDGITSDNIKEVIATYERSLYTPNSRFDQFLRGDSNALNDDEKEGYQLFKALGCISCHQGINIGGNMYQQFGILADYFTDRGPITTADLGRFNLTGEEQDRHVFKVPSLRLAAVTPPYFHDGSAQTLEAAITVMAKYQLGRQLSAAEIDLLAKFLKTVPGEYEGVSLESQIP